MTEALIVHNIKITPAEISELKRKASLAAISAQGWRTSEHLIEQVLIWCTKNYNVTKKES